MIFSHPGFIFSIFLLLASWLHSWGFFVFYLKPDPLLMIVFICNFTLVLFALFVFAFRHNFILKTRMPRAVLRWEVLQSRSNIILILYVIISILDILYSKGVPLVWALTGSSKNYTDFGVPTLHGIANSLVFVYFSLSFFLYIQGRKVNWTPMVFLVLFQVVILSRGVLVVVSIQILCLYLLYRPLTLSRLSLLFFAAVLGIILFGILGDLRNGENPYLPFLSSSGREFFDGLPSGFLWFYAYFSGGINNLVNNVDLVGSGNLFHSVSKLVPSVVYSVLEIDKTVDTFQLVVPFLNVSTFYSGYMSDFGLMGFVSGFVFILLSHVFWRKAIKGSPFYILSLPILFQAGVHAVFIDTFLYTVFVFQFFVVLFVINGSGMKASSLRVSAYSGNI